MTADRRVVIATTSFANAAARALVGKHPAVIAPGVVQQGTRLYSDDPIVRGSDPSLFVDAGVIPGAPSDTPTTAQPTAPNGPRLTDLQPQPEWIATVRAYRAVRAGHPETRPTQEEVARGRGMGERTLMLKLRAIGIKNWHDVHALIEAEP